MTFLICFIILASTDAFDGFIARRFNQKTELGKKLDSLADLPFFVSTAYFVYVLFPEFVYPNIEFLYVVLGVVAASFVVSYFRLGKPMMLHTWLLKIGACLVFAIVVLSFFLDTTYLITFVLVIYFFAYVEEIIIFLKYGEVDPDTKSVFYLRK